MYNTILTQDKTNMKSTYKKKRLLNIQKNVLLVGNSKYTLEKTEEAIKNEQSREYRRGNQEWTIQRNWQHWEQKTRNEDKHEVYLQENKVVKHTN